MLIAGNATLRRPASAARWIHTKPQLIDALAQKRLEYKKLDTSDVTVEVYGDAAVVRGKSSDAFFTITFVNGGEGWKAVSETD